MGEIMKHFSMVPVLYLIQVLAIAYAARHAVAHGNLRSKTWIHTLLLILTIWGGIATRLAFMDVYESNDFLTSYPGFWLPFVPVILVLIPLMLFRQARDAVRSLIDATPISWIVGIHALRILAIGTLIKAWKGEFSMSFALYVGIPDLIFGLSALVMIWLVKNERIGRWGLILWNIVGVFAILPGVPAVVQMGLPGLFQSITETPSITTLFAFPMVLAPALIVPIFVMINLFVVFRFIERGPSYSIRNTAEGIDS